MAQHHGEEVAQQEPQKHHYTSVVAPSCQHLVYMDWVVWRIQHHSLSLGMYGQCCVTALLGGKGQGTDLSGPMVDHMPCTCNLAQVWLITLHDLPKAFCGQVRLALLGSS